MSGTSVDQLHRSTLGVYSSLTDEFNPGLQKLVLLGNGYVQAFKALAAASEAYFTALSKMGEKAFHTESSRSIGDVLIQISESQRRLTLELEGVFCWFGTEVLQEMDNNVRLDQDYLLGSLRYYEMEVHNQRAAQETQLRRSPIQDSSEFTRFLRQSHEDALREEERRYRFLAEKHCGLIRSIARLMNKMGGSLQHRADAYTAEANASRCTETRPQSCSPVGRTMEEDFGQSRTQASLSIVPFRAPSPQGSISRSAGCGERSMRTLVAHRPASPSPTLLPFSRGEMITVLIQQPRNGWLFGRAEDGACQGWFPATFVEPVDDPPPSLSSSSILQSSASISNQPGISSQSGAPPPPLPPPLPPPPSKSSSVPSEMQPAISKPDNKPEPNLGNKTSQPQRSHPELFPRGTNPFATVKLKPTSTNDRSAPRLCRR